MRKNIILIFVLLLLTACGIENHENIIPVETYDSSEITTTTQTTTDVSESAAENADESVGSQKIRIDTLDDAVKWYLNEKEAHKYSEGQHFFSSYRILDIEESSESITIYTHILCEWISSSGETVSGGAGLISITFKTNDDVYEYDKSMSYIIPDAPEIPQKVKESVSNATYFKEMRSEIDENIADFLESSQ